MRGADSTHVKLFADLQYQISADVPGHPARGDDTDFSRCVGAPPGHGDYYGPFCVIICRSGLFAASGNIAAEADLTPLALGLLYATRGVFLA
jgi:hypothetical protein